MLAASFGVGEGGGSVSQPAPTLLPLGYCWKKVPARLALSSSSASSAAGVRSRVCWRRSAAAPDTCAAEADVPVNPPAPQNDECPNVSVETLSKATMSG